MKKSFCFMKIVSALFALALFASCDTGGGGGGGGGGNSAQTSKTNITITIPSATSSSSDINLLGDFGIDDTENFRYEIYFKKGTKEIARKEGTPGKTVTFDNVTYDTYDFFLDIYVDSNKITKLDILRVLNKTVSASNNTVTFPDMSTSTYKNWYFVKNVADLNRALSEINAEGSPYNTSNKLILCLLATIEDPRADSVKGNSAIQLVENGYSFAAHLYTVTLPSDLPEGCSVTTNNADNKFAEDDTVMLTVTAADGWLFFPPTIDEVTITQSEEDSTQFTFDMPADDVEVTTTFFDAIYVSASGTTGNDGLSEATAVDSLASAINKINYIGSELSLESFDWTIKVCGTIRGAQTVVYPMLYGTASVTIVGVDNGIIDGNEAGTALTIDLTVPVTIKNLTIQNGQGNSSSSDSAVTGGGMTISATSTVTIESGVVIKNNSAGKYGGGILNRGILTINGGVIQNNTAGTYGGGIFNSSGGNIFIYGSTTISGNRCINNLKYGGGIYNSSGGNVYLGYKNSSEKGTWIGSISSNTANQGGSIWNATTAKLYFDSGSISSNTTNSTTSASISLMGDADSSSALYLGTSAEITGGDKIYFSGYNISSDPLSPDYKFAKISVEEDTNTIALTIASTGYKSGTQILTGAAVGTSYTNFSLTNAGGYKIGDEGKLVTKDVDEFTTDDFAQFGYNNVANQFPNTSAELVNKILIFQFIDTTPNTFMVMKITSWDDTNYKFTGSYTLYKDDGTTSSLDFSNVTNVNLKTGDTDEFDVPMTQHLCDARPLAGIMMGGPAFKIVD